MIKTYRTNGNIPISTNIVNTTERETCQPHNRTIQAKRKRTTERERRTSLTTELRNKVIVNNTGKYVRDELQKKESNIDRQTVKKEDNHDHNNLVSYQCIKYFTKFTKYCVKEITTPVDCPRVSLVIIIIIIRFFRRVFSECYRFS